MSAPLRTPRGDPDLEAWAELARRYPGSGAAVRALIARLDELEQRQGSGSPGLVFHMRRGSRLSPEVLSGETLKVWAPAR